MLKLPASSGIEHSPGLGDDALAIGTDQARHTGFDAFRTFGGVPQDKHRHSQAGSFLLNATGIGEDNTGALHQMDHGKVVQRLNKRDIFEAAQQLVHRFLGFWIQMHQVNKVNSRIAVGRRQFSYGFAHLPKRLAKAFPPMRCNQH